MQFFGIPSGVVPGRATNRKPMTYAMTAFCPIGPFYDADVGVYIGGTFWDGRAPDEPHQATQPFIDANEMANLSSNGIQDPVAGGYSALVVKKVQSRPYTPPVQEGVRPGRLHQVHDPADLHDHHRGDRGVRGLGRDQPVQLEVRRLQVWHAAAEALHALRIRRAREDSVRGRTESVQQPEFGLPNASSATRPQTLDLVQAETDGKETFTMFCFANIGVPKNPNNPYYENTDPIANPYGYNPLGTKYIDYGLGANPNPAPDGTRFYNTTPGDILQFRGLFKAPSVRNSDKRPYPTFVRAYMHNGVFKSLQEVVHFYNKRNIAVNAAGQEVAFDLRNGPPSGYTPLLPPPEVLDNVQNVAGLTPAQAAAQGVSGVVATNGQVGNLQLTASQEADLVNFLKILTDGYGPITPVSFP